MKTIAIIAIVLVVGLAAGAGSYAVLQSTSSGDGGASGYTVSFSAENGTVNHTSLKVPAGASWTADTDVLKFSDGQTVTAHPNEGYKFSQWSESTGTVSKNTSLKATFVKKDVELCKVSFVITGGQGTVPAKVTVPKDTTFSSSKNTLTFSDGTKVKAEPSDGFSFDSWSPSSGKVSTDMNISVKFSGKTVEYTVKFTAGSGGTVSASSIKVASGTTWTQKTTGSGVLSFSDGQSVSANPNTGYKFASWSQSSGTVTGDVTLNATFEQAKPDDCTVKFNVASGKGTVPSQITVSKGTTFSSSQNKMSFSDGKSATAEPSSGYAFGSWDPSSGTVTSDVTINVNFTSQTTTYTVTIMAGTGGTVSKKAVTADSGVTWSSSGTTLSFSNGDSVSATPNPDYSFGGWSPASGTVTSDLTITATFSGGSGGTVSFFFMDNFENDGFQSTDMYASYAEPIIPGIWVKGSGSSMEAALKDACKTFGVSVTVTSGKITEMNGAQDGNLYLWGWNGSGWICKNGSGSYLTLNDMSPSTYSYVAVIHGANDAGSGNAPSVGTTPNNIQWYYGDTIAPGSGKEVKFYLNNVFTYTHFTSSRADASDYQHLIVQGLWVRGYADNGSPVMKAFINALDRIGYEHDLEESGFIRSVNKCAGGNFLQAIWDNASGKYYEDTGAHWFIPDLVDTTDYAGLSYGAWDEGYITPPWPLEGAADCDWAY